MTADNTASAPDAAEKQAQPQHLEKKYKIQFRADSHLFLGRSQILDLRTGDLVMVHTDHGPEPCRIRGFSAQIEVSEPAKEKAVEPAPAAVSKGRLAADKGELHYEHPSSGYQIIRQANQEEQSRYELLVEREVEAFAACREMIKNHKLRMKLIRVERFFNGSKIIFYFTAEKRVDFRNLVKDLVQEFRTRVEMRQIGVRHETKMLGGLGCCGRELCCSSFIREFAPVSIKMAKEQDLPLNPAKISGICNRLLCCLTYEFPLYREMKRIMPQPGRLITIDGKNCKVIHQNVIKETVTIVDPTDSSQTRILERNEWRNAEKPPRKPPAAHKKTATAAKKGKPKPRPLKAGKK